MNLTLNAPVTSATSLQMRPTQLFVTVNGVPTMVEAVDTQHGVNQKIGTASIEMILPNPGHVTLNAPIEVQAGFKDSGLATIFSGRITDASASVSDRGFSDELRAAGWATLLDFRAPRDLVYPPSSMLQDIFRSLCQLRRVPKYQADDVRYPGGITPVRLGGNPLVDNGNVVIPRRTTPLAWLDQKVRLFGYRVFDTPSGVLRLKRVSGMPPGAGYDHGPYDQGVNAYEMGRQDDVEPMVNYWEVRGARYTDADGVNVEVRSIPASVPYAWELDPPGYRADGLSDDALVSVGLADAVRNVQEIDWSRPYEEESWEIDLDHRIQPGDIAGFRSLTLAVPATRRLWAMSVRNTASDRGYSTTVSGWAGAGVALPAGNDAVSYSVGVGPYHLGDETIPWYAVPAPSGTTRSFWLTVPDEYTSIVLSGKAHGTNSYFIEGANSESTVSTIEVWQAGEKVGSTDLPVLPENYARRLPYSNVAHWTSFRLPVPGRLEPGSVRIDFVAGEDKKATGGPIDDYEIRDVWITLAGVGQPILPGGM